MVRERRDPEQRPSPEALLEAARREESASGKLKIFVGAAPGVGKTYEMLQQARVRKQDGYDVAVGVVETHGRKETQALLERLTAEQGYLDGRYMAATFNLLRGRDLIWSYVVNNYLLGQEPAPFDLLYWNSDTTNLPAMWHKDYIESFYKGNKLAEKGGIRIAGTPIDISLVKTATYVQAGREDHISPPQSVWKIMNHFAGPKRFVLAGSGHIAGVVNPPTAQKYQYWTNDRVSASLEEFVEGATEHKGSWWPDWLEWIKSQDPETVKAEGPRVPGKGKLKPIEDAPGSYVKAR